MILYRIIFLISVLSMNESVKVKRRNFGRLLTLGHALGHLSNVCFKNQSMILYGENVWEKLHFYVLKNIYPETPVLSTRYFAIQFDIVDEESQTILGETYYLPLLANHNALLFTYSEHHFLKPLEIFDSIASVNTVFFILSLNDRQCNRVQSALKDFYLTYQRIYNYLCFASNGEYMIYTINPFATQAPSSWELFDVLHFEYGRKLSIFSRPFRKEHVCQELNFDRTINLDGYLLQIAIPTSAYIGTSSRIQIYRRPVDKNVKLKNVQRHLQELILQLQGALNVSVGGYVYQEDEELTDRVFNYKEVRNIKADIILADIIKDQFTFYETLKFPSRSVQYGIVSHNREPKTVFEKIREFYGIKILLLTIFVLAVTFIGVCLIERQFSFASFEILRLLITNSLETHMITLSSRILFGTIFLYFLIMQTTFSGNMINFVTLFVKRKNAESLGDLLDPQYKKIYMLNEVRQMMSDLEAELLNQKISISGPDYCVEEATKNSSVVCVTDYYKMHFDLLNYPVESPKHGKIHVSLKPIFDTYMYYAVCRFSLLNERFRIFMMQNWENGIHSHLIQTDQDYTVAVKRRFHKEYLSKINEKKSMRLEGLAFAFQFLGFGLICATLSFIIELIIYHRYVRRRISEKIIQPSSHDT